MHIIENIKNYIEEKHKILVIGFFIVFLIVGFFAVNDYGMSTDELAQRKLGNNASKLILNNDRVIHEQINKYHGTGFTFPVNILERIFNLET